MNDCARPSDYDVRLVLRIQERADGDVVVSIGPSPRGIALEDSEGLQAVCEFSVSGTLSPRTTKALRAVIGAMEADSAERPWPPAGRAS
jgi:hypothetical protein